MMKLVMEHMPVNCQNALGGFFDHTQNLSRTVISPLQQLLGQKITSHVLFFKEIWSFNIYKQCPIYLF